MPDSREALIETTRALLWERGYAATSPNAILRAAGVGQGSMYHHFRGKESLAREAFMRNAATVEAKAAAVLHGDDRPAVDRLVAYLELERDVLLGCPLGRMAGDPEVVGSTVLHPVLADSFERVRDVVAGVVAAAVRADEFSIPVDVAQLADLVLAVVQGGYVLARAAGRPEPFDRAVAAAVVLVRSATRAGSHLATEDTSTDDNPEALSDRDGAAGLP